MSTLRQHKYPPGSRASKPCYNCSQRRVTCDRALPKCGKCLKRGLSCPGYGIRIRFKDDLPAQTKKRRLVGELRSAQNASKFGMTSDDDLPEALPSVRGPMIPTAFNDGAILIPFLGGDTPDDSDTAEDSNMILDTSVQRLSLVPPTTPCPEIDASLFTSDYFSSTTQRSAMNTPMSTNPILYQHPYGDSQVNGYLTHFSTEIAKTMITFDSLQNGYRRLLLPLAHSDSTVRDALVAASAHHLAFKCPALTAKAEQHKASAIQGLIRRQRDLGCNKAYDLTTIATLVVLMVDDMIVGSSDFAHLYRMLGSLMTVAGGEECISGTDIGDFLLRQINMLHLTTSPFLRGGEALSTQQEHFQKSVEFINAELPLSDKPEIDFIKSTLVNCYFQASQLYSNRVNRHKSFPNLVRNIRASVELLEPGSPGEHVLVWVYFMAAAESSTSSDRKFFLRRLQQCHIRTGFGNILRAYDLLSKIWANQGQSWTDMLIKEPKALIM